MISKVSAVSFNSFSSSIDACKDLILLTLSAFEAIAVWKSGVVCWGYFSKPMILFEFLELSSSSKTCIKIIKSLNWKLEYFENIAFCNCK